MHQINPHRIFPHKKFPYWEISIQYTGLVAGRQTSYWEHYKVKTPEKWPRSATILSMLYGSLYKVGKFLHRVKEETLP